MKILCLFLKNFDLIFSKNFHFYKIFVQFSFDKKIETFPFRLKKIWTSFANFAKISTEISTENFTKI